MGKGRGWKICLAILAVCTMVFAFGCSKKQAVKSTDTSGTAGAPAGAPSQGKEGVVTETLKPEAGTTAPSGGTSGTQVASAAEAAAGIAATEEKASPFQDVHFDFDKSSIRDDAKQSLSAVAAYLKNNRNARVQIEGHCDERGTSEYNMALGDRRAESVRKYLASLGVQTGVLSTVSYGKEKPLDPGHNEDAWAKNRRAHFVVK